jgi:hypothetical protein
MCLVVYDFNWFARWLLFRGSKYLKHITESKLNIYWIIWILNKKIEQQITERIGLNKSRTIKNWHKQLCWQHWIKHECHSKGWNVTIQHLHRVKYLCYYGTDNYNPICPGIKGVTSDMLTRTFFLLQQAEYFIKAHIKHGRLTFNTIVQSHFK